MSCRFFLFSLILIPVCFSSIHISPNQYQLQYSSINTHRIKRRTTSEKFQIHIHYDKSVEKYFFRFSNVNRILSFHIDY